MFSGGLPDEVQGLWTAGFSPELRPLRSIGYRQATALLQGRATLAAAIEDTYVATRRYAKRQRTWFRAEPGLRWLDAERPETVVESALRELFE
jgi:tRNA dimethylallyltransferase